MWLQSIRAAIVAAMLIVGGVALFPASPASASDWCWDDPILLIDGKLVNVNVGVKGGPSTVGTRVLNAHTKVYLPRNVSASIVGFTNVYFPETAEIVRVDWLQYEPGKKAEMEIHVSFTMASGSPEMDAQVDVMQSGYRTAGNSGKTTTGVKVQYQLKMK